MRRPPSPQDDDRNNFDKDRDHDDEDDNDDHRGVVETNVGGSDGKECYPSLFDNTTIRYLAAAMVEWPRGAELIFAGDLNVELEITSGR